MKKYLCLILLVFSQLSCTIHEQDMVRRALEMSGSNRQELEKVLEHYRNEERKLQAAEFLIAHMPYHSSRISEGLTGKLRQLVNLSKEIWADQPDISAYRSATIAFDSLRNLPDNIYQLNFIKVRDIDTINSDYLIRHIDLAFEIWDKVPWKEQFTREYFFENILPYRIYNEALTDWREKYYQQFGYILDSLPQTKDSYIVACQRLCDAIEETQWFHVDNFIGPWVDALTLMENRYGGCREKSAFTLYAMRALCIPGSLDVSLQHPDKMFPTHYWNQFPDLDGNPVIFEIFNENLPPVTGSRNDTRKRGVIYRTSYHVDAERLPLRYYNHSLPEKLRDPLLSNVSHEYFPSNPIQIELPDRKKEGRLVFLGVFNNRDWIPVTGSRIDKGIGSFSHLEPGIVYMPVLYQDGLTEYFSVPFLLQGDGKAHYFKPDSLHPIYVNLYRKHPLPSSLEFLKRFLVGGVFQGANRPDFSDAYDLYTVEDHNDLMITRIPCNTDREFRYIRYLSAPEGKCNMAELKFYDPHHNLLKGDIIGTSGSHNNHPERTIHAVFDNDPLTFYNAKEASGAWVGLDLKTKTRISEIEFQFRNDDNLIREGELYELFYFTNHGLKSLGKKYGTREPALTYENAPGNALFWLRNYTKGREERIFTYENGKQIWW